MKNLTRTAIVTIAAASIGAATLAPALAQPFGGARDGVAVHQIQGEGARSFRPAATTRWAISVAARPSARVCGLVEMFFSNRGAEAIDIAAVRLTLCLS